MRFTPVEPYLGVRPMQGFFNPSDDVPTSPGLGGPVLAVPMGTIVKAFDPYWGGAEFMYVRANGAIRAFGLCVVAPTFDATDGRWRYEATEVTAVAGQGRSLGVAIRQMSAGQYGWMCVGGVVPVNSNASVAAGTVFGIAAAGQAGANVNGRQVLNGSISAAATTTVAKSARVTAGSAVIQVSNIDGWFVGAFMSGTGIPAATTISAIDPSANAVTLSAAATASGQPSVTATYNNGTIFYNVAHLNRPFAQGAIL